MKAQDIIKWLQSHVQKQAQLRLDSRRITPGDVFFACPGFAGDGRQHVEAAIAAGAAALVVQAPAPDGLKQNSDAVPVLEVEGLVSLMGETAHLWYGCPSDALSVVAVTGTNGKTTTVQWIAAALNADGVPCGTIGTLGATLPDGRNLGGELTTPDVLSMHGHLAAMRAAGAEVVAIEASSIGVAQGRLDAVHIKIAAFTNLTHDHLDYHGTLGAYRDAKFALFDWPGLETSIVNADDGAGVDLLSRLAGRRCLSYSIESESSADIRALDIHAGTYGLIFNISRDEGSVQVLTRLIGLHNVSNLLLVAGVLQELGWSLSRTARIMSELRPVEGRLQIVEAEAGTANGPMVVVDYAHTPDALERALVSLRSVAEVRGGRIVCVFGCGGSRDPGKRSLMGGVAERLADRVIVTNDNPRDEEPEAIAAAILSGMKHEPLVELDRAAAILTAVWCTQPTDIVLLAGKGHETYQEVRGVRSPFDDREWARFALTWRAYPKLTSDSRTVAPGQIFLALSGERFDGHDYVERAAGRGAIAAIVAHSVPGAGVPQFVLGDTRQALIRIASTWRRLFDLPLIAVTGSNGKTTTKEMIAAILKAWLGEGSMVATQGNLNNDIGVPLSVLRLSRAHRAAVFELGMNHPGEIALLADIAHPTIALVNNAQREHQEFMHTVDAVAEENGTVLKGLGSEGVAVYPGDDTYTDLWRDMAGDARSLCFGFESHFQIYADEIHAEPTRTVFRLHTPLGAVSVTLNMAGVHNLRNALAAAACSVAAGAPLEAIARGLEAFNPVAGRMQLHTLPDGHQLIDDSYNANPDSVRAAIDVLADLPGRRTLVLGTMGEIGANSPAMHAEVGAYALERGIDMLFTFGNDAAHAARAFGDGALSFEDIPSLVAALADQPPGHVLVKGSRSTRMERVIEEIIPAQNGQTGGNHAA
ncbi:bifunctional UDP-N-acetylmuramoyl-L-alanyl-D-glutamate--2,6-diaminopimelate ligase MurE/UDP-N-acetylmuramoyl-tripeptide--D-alanyl-D-alanine ligase MurF [Achromobacter sp. F4_2707]|uniref:bifunctional UDP-N-acetylmuramoyl-L-alanyl-D-glutamate--2, 6-diaminopimelate ligase MurE/UDP-N-acetylmuramoyl-tripeptide--D-alanyl-D-alanine ligase MurF n=1 Tax=Achromobacter sp. F4_2707 TaxID=3114286 RepID=UPI0039C6B484